MIDGVSITSLQEIPDERGQIMHMMRNDDPEFDCFGEIYFSVVYPGAIKAWHLHKVMTLNYAVIFGHIKLVLYDSRPSSPTEGMLQEIFPSESNYNRVRIPPGVYNGFKGIGTTKAIVANCATHPHDPDEILRLDPFSSDIPYDWSLHHG